MKRFFNRALHSVACGLSGVFVASALILVLVPTATVQMFFICMVSALGSILIFAKEILDRVQNLVEYSLLQMMKEKANEVESFMKFFAERVSEESQEESRCGACDNTCGCHSEEIEKPKAKRGRKPKAEVIE